MKRRSFLIAAACAAPALSLFPADLSGVTRKTAAGKLEKRSLGRTGEMLSVIGFGGIVVKDTTPEQASEYVNKAIEAGVNYFDVAPSYGNAEVMLGPALEPYRSKVFLACKTTMRTKEDARRELEQSLRNLRTDHFDLYQHHAVTTLQDVDTLLGRGGAMETFIEARNEGKIKFIGFSAHSVEAAMALMDRFDFDTILFPLHYSSWYPGNFGPQVIQRARDKNIGILALKAMARGSWPQGADRSRYPKCWYQPLIEPEDILMGLRFTLSHPVTAAVSPGEGELFLTALGLSDRLQPLTESEVAGIKAKALAGMPLFRYEGS